MTIIVGLLVTTPIYFPNHIPLIRSNNNLCIIPIASQQRIPQHQLNYKQNSILILSQTFKLSQTLNRASWLGLYPVIRRAKYHLSMPK